MMRDDSTSTIIIIIIIIIIIKGNRTEWCPIWSESYKCLPKSNNHQVGIRFVNHEHGCRQNSMT